MTDKRKSYYNTLIFTIISAILSVILLVLLMIRRMRQFLPFIITLLIGIFIMIIWCIIMIVYSSQEKDDRAKNATLIKFDSCPDYFIKDVSGTTVMCKNAYSYTGDDGNTKKMVFYPVNSSQIIRRTHVPNGNLDMFELDALEKSNDIKTSKDKCGVIFNENNTGSFSEYQHLPWTTVRAKCASLHNN